MEEADDIVMKLGDWAASHLKVNAAIRVGEIREISYQLVKTTTYFINYFQTLF